VSSGFRLQICTFQVGFQVARDGFRFLASLLIPKTLSHTVHGSFSLCLFLFFFKFSSLLVVFAVEFGSELPPTILRDNTKSDTNALVGSYLPDTSIVVSIQIMGWLGLACAIQ
jgi:hypothetical protein